MLLDLIIRFIQYLVSFASFKAIKYLDKKSFFDCAYLASEQFAPILVPLLRNCFDNIDAASLKCLNCQVIAVRGL